MKKIALLFAVVILVGVILVGAFVNDAYFTQPTSDAAEVVVIIEPGTSVEGIAQQLDGEGIISNERFFQWYVRLTDATLQAGTFELLEGMNFRSVVNTLERGYAQEVQITIPEGYTVEEIGEVVTEAFEGITEEDWEQVTNADAAQSYDVSPFRIPQGQSVEGYLFPDTYRFRADVSTREIVETMISTLKRRVAEREIVVPESGIFETGLNPHELMVLASILQREVRNLDEMQVVAGIFYTRLEIGMALQADSTVNYVTGKDDPGVTYEDSRIESEYNTYVNLGLPPGPISNPGIDAIIAALNPIDSDYLYFLTDEEGQIYYGITYDQHLENKRKYLD